MNLSGIATFCRIESTQLAVGYFISDSDGIFKLSARGSNQYPEVHQCCLSGGLEQSIQFWDLTVKQNGNEWIIPTLQEVMAGSDYFALSSEWNDQVQGSHSQESGAEFAASVVKVGKDAVQIVRKYFKSLDLMDCVVTTGNMKIWVEKAEE